MIHPPKSRFLRVFISTGLMLAPCVAHANAGIPMLALAWPLQWLSLIPIVLLECAVSQKSLQVPFRQLIWPFGKANIISTLVGIPIAWCIMLIPLFFSGWLYHIYSLESMPIWLFPLTVAWLGGDSAWEVYFAFVVLAVPFCLISIFIEKRVLYWSLPAQDRSVIHAVAVRANVLSYAMLSSLALIFPLSA